MVEERHGFIKALKTLGEDLSVFGSVVGTCLQAGPQNDFFLPFLTIFSKNTS